MPLTPDEQFQRSLTDPYYRLAQDLGKVSLARQKGISLAAATVEKKRKLDPAQAIADELQAVEEKAKGDLGDIIESGFYRSRENIFDAISGYTPPPGVDRNAEIQEYADQKAGLQPGDRQLLIGNDQQQVATDVANTSLAFGKGNYLEAAKQGGNALLSAGIAAPGTVADSAMAFGEIALGSLLTAAIPGSGVPLLARRGQKVIETGKKALGVIDKTKSAISAAAKAASQVSIVTVDQVQAQVNDFTKLHGVAPTRAEATQMFITTMASYMLEPTVIKNLFVPKFREVIGKEIRTLGKNLVKGSNLKNIGVRILDGTKKAAIAGGAEAGQEYFQTWVENLNVGMGPEQRKDFLTSLKELTLDSKDNQLQAITGALLGAGAGSVIRGGISAPGIAVGTAADLTKASAKGAVKTVVGSVKLAGKGVQAVANQASYKVLSQEERNVIASEYGSKKATVDATEKDFDIAVDKIKRTTTAQGIKDIIGQTPPITQAALTNITEALGGLDKNSTAKDLKKVKDKIVSSYRGEITLIKTELETSNIASIAARSAKNIEAKSVAVAKSAMEALDPGVKAVVAAVKDLPPKVIQAAEELRSSAARGIVDLAATAGKKEIDTIVKAAQSLSMDDLKRTTNIVNQIKPEIGRKLERVIQIKERALKRTGLKVNEIANSETLHPIIKDVAKRAVVAAKEIAALSSAVNKTVASTFDDLVALKDTEAAVAAIEKSDSFKKQINGAMTKQNLETVKRKLTAARVRLEGESVTIKDQVVQGVKDAVKAATPVVKAAAESVGRAVKGAIDPEVKIDRESLEPSFRAKVELVGENLNHPVQGPALVQKFQNFVDLLKDNDIKTRKQFEALIREFPELRDNVPFYNSISGAYPSNVNVKEVWDNLATKTVGTTKDIAAAIKKAYNEVNIDPVCKI